MKLLLTSAGIKNPSIHDALVDLLGKPIAECSALCIPTAAYGHPLKPQVGWRFISGNSDQPMTELGWKSVGVLELTALPSIDRENWGPLVRETDESHQPPEPFSWVAKRTLSPRSARSLKSGFFVTRNASQNAMVAKECS